MPLKKLSLALTLFLVISTVSAQWTKQNVNSNKTLERVVFADSLNCYISGHDALIYRSSDGGENWTKYSFFQAARIYDMYFFDSIHGFACGDNGSIGETFNGGQSWTKRNLSTIETHRGIYFRQNYGIVVADKGRIFRSNDTGRTWLLDSVPVFRGMNDVVILPGGKCISVGDTGMIFTRRISDSAWAVVSSPTNITLRTLQFIDDAIGYAAGGQFDPLSGYKNVFLYTTDSGVTWTERFLTFSKQINDIHFINKDTGFAACSDGHIMKTVNGGVNWFRMAMTNIVYLSSVAFYGSRGLMVGDIGSVYKTSNLGGYILSAGEEIKVELGIYPNPAKDLITLEAPGFTIKELALYDLQEKILAQGTVENGVFRLPEGLSAGIYIVRVADRSLGYIAASKLIID